MTDMDAKMVCLSIVNLIRGVQRERLFVNAEFETREYGPGMVEYRYEFEHWPDDRVMAMLSVTLYERGHNGKENEKLGVCIRLQPAHEERFIWNKGGPLSIRLPVYRDGDAMLGVYPVLLQQPQHLRSSEDSAAALPEPTDLKLLISATVKHFIPLFRILENTSGWIHSIKETWTQSFNPLPPPQYTLDVTSTGAVFDTRTFSISADPLSENVTVNTKTMLLAELEAFINQELGFKFGFPRIPFFKEQYSDLDKRIDTLLLRSALCHHSDALST